jgi:hypothetical protein
MEYEDIPKVSSVFFSDDIIVNMNQIKDLRKKVLSWLKNEHEINPRFRSVFNQSFGHLIYFTWQGLKNDVSESSENYTEKLLSFAVLPEIVEKAVYDKPVKHKDIKRTDVKCVHHFVS